VVERGMREGGAVEGAVDMVVGGRMEGRG